MEKDKFLSFWVPFCTIPSVIPPPVLKCQNIPPIHLEFRELASAWDSQITYVCCDPAFPHRRPRCADRSGKGLKLQSVGTIH